MRLTLSQSRGSLGTAAWGGLILEPYQLLPLQRIEELPEPRMLIADDMGLGKTSHAGFILSRFLQRRRAQVQHGEGPTHRRQRRQATQANQCDGFGIYAVGEIRTARLIVPGTSL